MAKKKKNKKPANGKNNKQFLKKENGNNFSKEEILGLHPDTKKSIWAVGFFGLAVVLLLAAFKKAGPAGDFIFRILDRLFGVGYYLLPLTLLIMAGVFISSDRRKIYGAAFLGAALFVLSGFGLIDILFSGRAGVVGRGVGSIESLFGYPASIILMLTIIVISFIATLNFPIRIRRKTEEGEEPSDAEAMEGKEEEVEPIVAPAAPAPPVEAGKTEAVEPVVAKEAAPAGFSPFAKAKKPAVLDKDYIFPPLSLLKSSVEKPTSGDLRANANIIKRTLESFGIPVEMGEINIGPKVTRYTLKPAEGIKLTRILALSQDLALALAAHPIRIEAPIPGKSLVGIEVPNKAAALVRLGSLMAYSEFNESGRLGFVLGRDVTGEPIFANIEKMPHLLVAGSTGSGKSVAIHSLLVSLLYKNSPATLKMILIDPKRVELSSYENIPHLIAPVVTEAKKSVGVFRWAISEMERRYEILLAAGSRDIGSYNKKNPNDVLPYILIVIDELADLMASYGKEVEGSIVRLAQMARATGLHLVLSTQRPSVEVITGLIKANITARVALQVASGVDSRTILDASGAEKLLGGGDMLFTSSELSKPKRIQGAYLSEEEISKVTDFIRENNKTILTDENVPTFENGGNSANGSNDNGGNGGDIFDNFASSDDDELLDEAIKTVVEAQKASASLLQRRLKVGYARAARLLDIMEEKGVIGPGDGAKPRDVYIARENNS